MPVAGLRPLQNDTGCRHVRPGSILMCGHDVTSLRRLRVHPRIYIGNRRKSSLIGPCPDGYSSRRPKPASQLPCEGQSQHRLQKQGQPSVSLKFKSNSARSKNMRKRKGKTSMASASSGRFQSRHPPQIPTPLRLRPRLRWLWGRRKSGDKSGVGDDGIVDVADGK
jgi:hypothetical protein